MAGVVLGHSERRELFGETDAALARKVPAALAAGLLPILCVGETEDERDAGETERKLRQQIQTDLAAVDDGPAAEVVIAYEPIWAIGTGQAPRRRSRRRRRSRSCGRCSATAIAAPREQVRILYGGSVKAANAAELLAQPDVDGALVGGASLDPAEFARSSPRRPHGDEPQRRSRRRAGRARRLGARAAGPRQRGLARETRRCSTRSGGDYPHTQLEASGARGRPARRARWATPRSGT